jgi:excinuclease ABC subunit A
MSKPDPKNFIIIKNAAQNNLKNLNLTIAHNKIHAITGISGSGKSSLAFETLFEEGRRRYVESLSAYVRQFLGKIRKPQVDVIEGLPPAIAIEQKKSTSNSRSTVGTVTEVYDYLRLLYARVGKTFSPHSGKEVKRHQLDDVLVFISEQREYSHIFICIPLKKHNDRNWKEELAILLQNGFTRLLSGNEYIRIDALLEKLESDDQDQAKEVTDILNNEAEILIDRILPDPRKGKYSRIADSVQSAFNEGMGRCIVHVYNANSKKHRYSFSNLFEEDGEIFSEPEVALFSFNSPYGACKHCGGMGDILDIDEDKVIPNKNLSLYDGAVLCWEGEKMSAWKKAFIRKADQYQFPIFKAYSELSEKEKDLLWNGDKDLEGISAFFEYLQSQTYKIHYRIFISRFKGKTLCRVCKGTRLCKEASYVKIQGHDLGSLLMLPLDELYLFFQNISLEDHEMEIAGRLLAEINSRLQKLVRLGLSYLTLNRTTRSLSGGELQRIQLIHSIGSNLTGALYILDEPSIGLHPRDTYQLISILEDLKRPGNTVLVVEHDEDIIRAADEIIDLGPYAGENGGELILQGTQDFFKKSNKGISARFLNGTMSIPVPEKRRESEYYVTFEGASRYNLKNIDVHIPLQVLCVISGVSGSGKSTLLRDVIYGSLKNIQSTHIPEISYCRNISGAWKRIHAVEFVGQDSIDRSKRSNPITYIKVFDYIRDLMSKQQLSRSHAYTPAHFSFNVDGGRCEACKGEGQITVEMQFIADIHLECESCKGKRYKDEILEVRYKDKNIHDILQMTINEALTFFEDHEALINGLRPLADVGLGYLKMGQPTSTLSGGEAQRLKLASFLSKEKKHRESTLYIFDEPTTGLHWYDISKLLNALNALIDKGNTVLVIEHNMELIKCADYIIDLGPEGGEKGGYLIFQGSPEELISRKDSYTAKFLESKLNHT